MIIFNELTEDGFGAIKPTTKKIYIGIFGFFPHETTIKLDKFIRNDLNLEYSDEFSENQPSIVEVYNVCDRRTADLGYVLTIPFLKKEEAHKYITKKIKLSDYVSISDFDEIVFIDGYDFDSLLKTENDLQLSKDEANKLYIKEFKDFLIMLAQKYPHNTELLKILKDKQSKVKL